MQVVMDRATGRGKGFGFVTFEGTAAVDSLMRTKDHALQGKQVEVTHMMHAHPHRPLMPEPQNRIPVLFMGSIN